MYRAKPRRQSGKQAEVKRAGPARRNQGAAGLFFSTPSSLINSSFTPPVTGALGVSGLSGRASQEDDAS